MKKIISFLIIISMFFCSCQGYTYIEEGFTSKLTDVLQRQYEVTIPESAELITGYYDNAFKDNCLYLVFTIDAEDIETILSENWEINKYNNEINLFENIIDIKPVARYDYQKEGYTFFQYTKADNNNRITCCFQGYYPEYIY